MEQLPAVIPEDLCAYPLPSEVVAPGPVPPAPSEATGTAGGSAATPGGDRPSPEASAERERSPEAPASPSGPPERPFAVTAPPQQEVPQGKCPEGAGKSRAGGDPQGTGYPGVDRVVTSDGEDLGPSIDWTRGLLGDRRSARVPGDPGEPQLGGPALAQALETARGSGPSREGACLELPVPRAQSMAEDRRDPPAGAPGSRGVQSLASAGVRGVDGARSETGMDAGSGRGGEGGGGQTRGDVGQRRSGAGRRGNGLGGRGGPGRVTHVKSTGDRDVDADVGDENSVGEVKKELSMDEQSDPLPTEGEVLSTDRERRRFDSSSNQETPCGAVFSPLGRRGPRHAQQDAPDEAADVEARQRSEIVNGRRIKKEKKKKEKKSAAQRDEYREELELEQAILAIHYGADWSSAEEDGGFADENEYASHIHADHQRKNVEAWDAHQTSVRQEEEEHAWGVGGSAGVGAASKARGESYEHMYAANWATWHRGGVPAPVPPSVPPQWEAPWHAAWGGGLQGSAGTFPDVPALPGQASGSACARVPAPDQALGGAEGAATPCVHCGGGSVPHQAWPGPENGYPPWYPWWGSQCAWPPPEEGPHGSAGPGTEAVPGPDEDALGASEEQTDRVEGGRSRTASASGPQGREGPSPDEDPGRGSPQGTAGRSPGDRPTPSGQAEDLGIGAEKEIREEYVRVPISMVRRYYELEYEAWMRRYKEWQELYYSYACYWPGYQQAWSWEQAQASTSAAPQTP